MLNPRWIKLLRDVQAAPGRTIFMLLAMAAGIFALATLLSGYTLLKREIGRNYLATHPASASLAVENVDAAAMERIRTLPALESAQLGARVKGSIYSADGVRHPITVFVIEDFQQININRIFPEAGVFGSAPKSLLLERNSLKSLKAQLGDHLRVQLGNSELMTVAISGAVHDPAMAFSNFFIYAYADLQALRSLGITAEYTDLYIRVRDQPFNAAAIEHTASELAQWLVQQGYSVGSVRIPPPGEHPHQSIMMGVASALLVFSFITFMLSAILMATILGGQLAQQARQIGVMKTLGGTTGQIAIPHLSFIFILAFGASAIGIPCGIVFGRSLAKGMLVNWLNFNVQDFGLHWFIYLCLIFAGVLVPIGIAAIVIIKACSAQVRAVLTQVGTVGHYFPVGRLGRWIARAGVNRIFLMSVRNCLRMRGRLLLVLLLLTTAGAVFISSMNVRKAVELQLVQAASERHYDLEIHLARPADSVRVNALLSAIAGVRKVEPYGQTTVARVRADGLSIEGSHLDGSHGAISLATLNPHSNFLVLPMQAGRALDAANADEVVLNHKAQVAFAAVQIGDEISLGIDGRAARLRVVGFAKQTMTGAMAYVTPATYQKITGQNDDYGKYRLDMQDHSPAAVEAVAAQIESVLEQQHFYVSGKITERQLRNEVDGHFTMLVNLLWEVAVLIAVVGMFGLSSVLAIQVVERAAEFGVMRSCGADAGIIVRLILVEGISLVLISCPFALLASFAVGKGIGYYLGHLIFGDAFVAAMSLQAMGVWLVFVLIGAVLACWVPARKAVRLTVRQTLAY